MANKLIIDWKEYNLIIEKLAIQIKDNISKVNVDNKRIINGTINTVLDKRFDTIIYIDVLEHIKESKKEISP